MGVMRGGGMHSFDLSCLFGQKQSVFNLKATYHDSIQPGKGKKYVVFPIQVFMWWLERSVPGWRVR
jgi:hypothetical protein